jgi:hypothetical protein
MHVQLPYRVGTACKFSDISRCRSGPVTARDFLEVSPCMSKRGGALFLLFRHLAHPARSAAVVQPNCARVFSRFALTFPFP